MVYPFVRLSQKGGKMTNIKRTSRCEVFNTIFHYKQTKCTKKETFMTPIFILGCSQCNHLGCSET